MNYFGGNLSTFADSVERLHNDGKTPDAISSILKVSTDRVRVVLRDLGITPHRNEPKAGNADMRRAIERHQELIREREYEA